MYPQKKRYGKAIERRKCTDHCDDRKRILLAERTLRPRDDVNQLTEIAVLRKRRTKQTQ